MATYLQDEYGLDSQNTFVTDDGQTGAFASPGDKNYTDFAGGTNPPAKAFGVGTGVSPDLQLAIE